MKIPRLRTLARIGSAAALALIAGAARAQSYGPDDQVLTIDATEFSPVADADGFIDDDGYLYTISSSSSSRFRASLRLPNGALIERLCQFDNDGNGSEEVQTRLVATKLVFGGGGGPASVVIANSTVSSAGDIGYGYYCTDSLLHTLRSTIDVDGDGNPDAAVYYVETTMATGLGLGGVQITWRRQVSPQPATATFDDVPLDDPYSPFIEALKASDVTGGCQQSPPLYCPDRPITRAEMAVFLAKAVGLHWVD